MSARRRSDDPRGTPLGRALADARAAAGLTQVPVALRTGITQARLSRMELGAAIPTAEDVAALLDLYGVGDEERRAIEALAREHGRVQDRRLVVQRGHTAALQTRWSRIMHESHLVRAYHPALVIGSLQTPSYARVVLDLDDSALAERAAQADALAGRDGQRHVLLQTEGSLRAVVGSAEVMREQLDQLTAITRSPAIRLGVIPAHRPMPFTCGTAFHLFEGRAFAYAVVGLEVAAATLDEPADVTHFTELFARLERLAVFDDDARAVLRDVAGSHGS